MISEIRERLLALQDPSYKAFQCKLLPTVDPERVIGVRMPALRRIARELTKSGCGGEYLSRLPCGYYEEETLCALLVAETADVTECIAALDRFLPFVDNWATCDSMRPKCLARDRTTLLGAIDRWLRSPHPYTVRFGIEMLMLHFLDEAFDPRFLARVASRGSDRRWSGGEDAASDGYYVRMMVAWYFAEALVKQYGAALPYLEERRLPPWIHRKTVQKACESFRISADRKQYLRSLRYDATADSGA